MLLQSFDYDSKQNAWIPWQHSVSQDSFPPSAHLTVFTYLLLGQRAYGEKKQNT